MNLTKAEMQHMVNTMTPSEIKAWCQQQAYKAWKDNNCRGTFEGATGVGKTRVGIMAADAEFKLNSDALVYIGVPTETLRDDGWPAEMRECGFEYLVDKTRRICYTSLAKEKPERDVDLFIGDEIHHITPANSIFFGGPWKVFKVLGLTATLPDPSVSEQDKDKRIIIDAWAPSVFKISIEEAIELKLVSDFEVTVLMFDLDRTDYYVKAGSAKKPFMQTEEQHYKFLSKQLGKAMYSGNEGFKFQCMQKRVQFLNNLRSKKLLAKEIMDKVLEGNRTLVFCGSIEQSVDLCGKQVYNSETTREQLDLFKEGKIDYLGCVQALNEGENIEGIDQGLVVQLNSRELGIIQRIGRHIRYRPGHIARIIVLVAKNTADQKWYESAFRNFNRSRIKEYYVIPEYRTAKGTVPAAAKG